MCKNNIPEIFLLFFLAFSTSLEYLLGQQAVVTCMSCHFMYTAISDPSNCSRSPAFVTNIHPCFPMKISKWQQKMYASLCAFCTAKDAKFLHADNQDSDQIVRQSRLIYLHWAHLSKSMFAAKISNAVTSFFNQFGETIKACLNLSLAEHDIPCLSKQCRSRSVGF